MPVAVMDSELYTRDTQENCPASNPRGPDNRLARVISAPDPIRPGTNRGDDRRPSLYLLPASLRNPHFSGESSTTSSRWTPPTSTSLDTTAERPEKRPRIYKDLEASSGKILKRGSSVETSPPLSADNRPSRTLSGTFSRSSKVSEHEHEHEHESPCPCFNCWDSGEMVSSLVNVVGELQSEIARTLPIRPPERLSEAILHRLTKQGVRRSLEWVVQELETTVRAMQGLSATTLPGLPSLTEVVPERNLAEMRRSSVQGGPSALATSLDEVRQLPILFDSSRLDEHHEVLLRPAERPHDPYISSQETSLPPILTTAVMKRTSLHEHGFVGPAPSPQSSGGSAFIPQSPMQSQRSNRTLPSPPNAQYPSPGFMGASQFSATSQAAHASHLQDLQHQISTKTLALQTLQREHDQLLAAFSRSQIRCNALDKKSQVSDHEINSLTEEKIRLQQQVESLEANVEELVQSRDDAHKQSSADGAQWRQIMAMSSQLQIKGAEEARKYKADRDAWEETRTTLEHRVRELESGESSSAGKQRASHIGVEDDYSNATSMEAMREEIIQLRRRCAGLERLLQELSCETDQIDTAINAMTSIRQRIANQKQRDDKS